METRRRALQWQLSLSDMQEWSKIWDINNQRAQRIHQKIGEMTAIDCQPISMIDDVGFNQMLKVLEPRYHCPSTKWFTEVIISKIFSEMRERANQQLSLTMDAYVNDTALLSLTAHWINSEFKQVSAVLNAQCLTEAYAYQRLYCCSGT